MLTFEIADEGYRVEIHGNKEGLLKLSNLLKELAESNEHESINLMTDDWGGSGLTNSKQGNENQLVNHVKLFVWPKAT